MAWRMNVCSPSAGLMKLWPFKWAELWPLEPFGLKEPCLCGTCDVQKTIGLEYACLNMSTKTLKSNAGLEWLCVDEFWKYSIDEWWCVFPWNWFSEFMFICSTAASTSSFRRCFSCSRGLLKNQFMNPNKRDSQLRPGEIVQANQKNTALAKEMIIYDYQIR